MAKIKFSIGDKYDYGDKFTIRDPFVITEIIGTIIRIEYVNDKCTASLLESVFTDRVLEGTYKFVGSTKPLDKAFKELDKQFCIHKNVRRDIFFTSKVFLTCSDCGKALN